jgi:hypothetical protein
MQAIPADRCIFPAQPPLGQQLAIHRTLLILSEAVRERVPKAIQAEMIRAACVCAVQKRAMITFMHVELPLLLTPLISAPLCAKRERGGKNYRTLAGR